VVDEPVDHGGGGDVVAEDLAPPAERLVAWLRQVRRVLPGVVEAHGNPLGLAPGLAGMRLQTRARPRLVDEEGDRWVWLQPSEFQGKCMRSHTEVTWRHDPSPLCVNGILDSEELRVVEAFGCGSSGVS
jgi:hypothetical protein